jgi:hypothetical protein
MGCFYLLVFIFIFGAKTDIERGDFWPLGGILVAWIVAFAFALHERWHFWSFLCMIRIGGLGSCSVIKIKSKIKHRINHSLFNIERPFFVFIL